MSSPDHSCEDPVFRRILVKFGYYDEESGDLFYEAFKPGKRDIDGLSVSVGKSESHLKYLTAQEVGENGSNQSGYYVAELSKKDIEKLTTIVADPVSDKENPTNNDPGHALLPELNYQSRKSDKSTNLMQSLNKLTRKVHGPFFPPKND